MAHDVILSSGEIDLDLQLEIFRHQHRLFVQLIIIALVSQGEVKFSEPVVKALVNLIVRAHNADPIATEKLVRQALRKLKKGEWSQV